MNVPKRIIGVCLVVAPVQNGVTCGGWTVYPTSLTTLPLTFHFTIQGGTT